MAEETSSPRAVNDAAREPGRNAQAKGFFARHEWTLVGALAVVAFALGCHGYAEIMTFTDAGGEYTRWDVVYATFQLYIFEADIATGIRQLIMLRATR